MSSLVKEIESWIGSVSQTSQEKTYTFATGAKYNDKDIVFTVNIDSIVLEDGAVFKLDDGTNTWTWRKDADGNVTIT